MRCGEIINVKTVYWYDQALGLLGWHGHNAPAGFTALQMLQWRYIPSECTAEPLTVPLMRWGTVSSLPSPTRPSLTPPHCLPAAPAPSGPASLPSASHWLTDQINQISPFAFAFLRTGAPASRPDSLYNWESCLALFSGKKWKGHSTPLCCLERCVCVNLGNWPCFVSPSRSFWMLYVVHWCLWKSWNNDTEVPDGIITALVHVTYVGM